VGALPFDALDTRIAASIAAEKNTDRKAYHRASNKPANAVPRWEGNLLFEEFHVGGARK